MGLFRAISDLLTRDRRAPAESVRDERLWFGRTLAGVWVNEDRALTYSAVFDAVRLIAEAMASLPFHVFRRRNDGGRDRVDGHPADRLISRRPNSEMCPFQFIETLQAWALTWGNGYAEIEEDGMGRPVGLWPLPPDRTGPVRASNGELLYVVKTARGGEIAIPARNVLHLRGLGWDGLLGYSVIALARESIALGLAAEQSGSALLGNGSRPSGVLEYPGKLTEVGRANVREAWEQMHKGPRNVGRVAILEEGMAWKQTGIPPEDAQFLESRRFQVSEIARWFHVPLHKLAEMDRSTFSNIEHQAIEFVVDTLTPWAVRWEQEINKKLLRQVDLFAKMNLNALLRGDTESRFDAYATGRQWGWLSANDVRRLEDMNPVDGGDVYLTPLNMVSSSDLGTLDSLQAARMRALRTARDNGHAISQ